MQRVEAEKLVRDLFVKAKLADVLDGRKLLPLVARMEAAEDFTVEHEGARLRVSPSLVLGPLSKLVEIIYRVHYPKGKRSGVRGRHAVRDHYLALAVLKLREAGYLPLTGKAKESACKLVARVAAEVTGERVSYATVEKSWGRTRGIR